MGPGVAGGPTAAAVVAASEGKAKKYGLLGLLGVIRMTDPDLNTLALGSDLTTVGLNLDSAEVREAGVFWWWLAMDCGKHACLEVEARTTLGGLLLCHSYRWLYGAGVLRCEIFG